MRMINLQKKRNTPTHADIWHFKTTEPHFLTPSGGGPKTIDPSWGGGTKNFCPMLMAACHPFPNPIINERSLISKSLCHIMNKSLRTGIINTHWLDRVLSTTIHKANNITDPGSYRPISIIPAVMKVLCGLFILSCQHIWENGLWYDDQTGFQPKHSTCIYVFISPIIQGAFNLWMTFHRLRDVCWLFSLCWCLLWCHTDIIVTSQHEHNVLPVCYFLSFILYRLMML